MEVVQYRDNFTMEAMLININVTPILSRRKFKTSKY